MSYSKEDIERALRIGLPIVAEINAVVHAEKNLPQCAITAATDSATGDAGAADAGAADAGVTEAAAQTPPMTMQQAVAYSSAKIGQIGETEIFEILRRRFLTVALTCNQSHSGDITVVCDGRKIVVEVKSYTNYVPRPQVDKFHRDLRETGAAGGVFISLRSGISNISDDFTIVHEHIGRFVPVVYLVRPTRSMVQAATALVCQLMGVSDYVESLLSTAEESQKALAAADNVHQHLSAARQKLINVTGEFSAHMANITGELTRSELRLQEIVSAAGVCGTSYSVHNFNNEITSGPKYAAYSAELQRAIVSVIEKVNLRHPRLVEPVWKSSAGRYTSVHTGIQLRLLASNAELILPRTLVTDAAVMQLYREHATNVSISDRITINILPATIKNITDILTCAD